MAAEEVTTKELHASSSTVQRDAELVAIEALSRMLGVALIPTRLDLGDGASVHVDGYHPGPPVILAEVFAHQGSLKGGQRHKLMSDAFKLVAVAKGLPGAKVMLVLTDQVAADGLQRGWRGVALKALGVEVMTVAIPDDVAEKVRAAQLRQRMTNAKGEA